jgi:adenylylsulfate kinase-like enzyme/CBS domain-containing protein
VSWAVWITGRPGSGKTAIAGAAARILAAEGQAPVVLELDAVYRTLAPSPSYAETERDLVYGALVYLARTLTRAGLPVIVDATAHRRDWRQRGRDLVDVFAEVQLVCPLEECRRRKTSPPAGGTPRAAYAAAPPGAGVPGVDLAYEPALRAELTIDTARTDVETAAASVAALARSLSRRGTPRLAPGSSAWVIWLTGLQGSGKSTLASALVNRLAARGRSVRVLDVAEARAAIIPDGRLDPQARDVMYRAIACAAALLAASGIRVVVDAAAPRRAWRDLARALAPSFAEVQVLCTSDLCGQRERAVRWSLSSGVGAGRPATSIEEGPELAAEYQPALAPELTIRTDVRDPWSAAEDLVRLAERLERSAGTVPFTCEETAMRVTDLMTREVITVRPDTPVFEARAMMLKLRIRHLLVTEADRLMGLITDRDIRLNLPSPATSLSVWEVNHLLARLTVGEVMTKSVIAVEPERDAREAAMIMLDHKIGALPVIEGTRVIGILTETDLVRAFARTGEPVAAGH